MPRMRSEDQLAFDEEVIENPDVEAALIARQSAKDALASVRKDFDAAHEKAKGALAMVELPEEGAVRIGRFRISKSLVSAKSVSFETKESTRLRITFMSEEAGPRRPGTTRTTSAPRARSTSTRSGARSSGPASRPRSAGATAASRISPTDP